MRSGLTPNRKNHTLSRLSPPTATDANGGPLSERNAHGSPYLRKVASNNGRTCW